MTTFEIKGEADCVLHGTEQRVFIVGWDGERGAFVQPEDGPTVSVNRSQLLPVRGPYFNLRGQVLTASVSHLNEVGEIVVTAKAASKRPFYKVRFADGVEQWFSDDEVFIEDVARS